MAEAKKKGRKKSYTREVVECIVIAGILAFVLRTFVVEAFKIPTKSMEPTLVGDESFGDRIIAAKWAYRSFGVKDAKPDRWEVAVFLYHDGPDSTKNYIKRCVGLPNERIAIYRGDLYVDGLIQHKPRKLQETLWHNVYEDDFESYDADGLSDAGPFPWKLSTGWRAEAGKLVVDTDRKSRIVYTRPILNLYVPPRPYDMVCPNCETAFTGWLDTAHNRIKCPGCALRIENAGADAVPDSRAQKSVYGVGQERPVGDIRLSFDLQFDKPGGTVSVLITKDSRTYTLTLPLGEGTARLRGEPRVSKSQAVKLEADRKHRVAFAHWDQGFAVWIDGRELTEMACDYRRPGSERYPISTADRRNSAVAIEAENAAATIDNIRIERDIHYLAYVDENSAMHSADGAAVYQLGPGQYWMMGDNSPASRDSRMWGVLREDDLVGRALFIWWPPDRIRLIR